VSSALLFVEDRVDEVADWSDVVDHVGQKSFDDFREYLTDSSGEIGRLDGPEFLADLLA
jgi:hypothetical protein